MNILLVLFDILQFVVISFLGHRLYTISYQKVEKDVVKDKIVLNKTTELPDYTKDVDPNYELLKNVIKSAKIEEWVSKIDAHYDYYDIYLNNAPSTISIRCRLRMNRGSLYVIEESVGVARTKNLTPEIKEKLISLLEVYAPGIRNKIK